MKEEKLLRQGLDALGLSYDEESIQAFDRFTSQLVSYNNQVNLTAVTEEVKIVPKHYLDSASLLLLPSVFRPGANVIDVGCGAGIPAFPLKFLRRDLKLTLLDSLQKRVVFQELVCRDLELNDVRCVHGRAEEAGQKEDFRQDFDVAVTRAVAQMNVICEYCLPFVKIGGYFVAMKGPDVEEELNRSKKAIELLGGTLENVQKVQIPGSDIVHTLITIKKRSDTPTKYPRNPGKIKKSPL